MIYSNQLPAVQLHHDLSIIDRESEYECRLLREVVLEFHLSILTRAMLLGTVNSESTLKMVTT